ncbi:MAG: MFS transporter [Gammaproteobacteria bacterium]|nr:MFS transporter [Gammaproteobacteria bacterium]
MIGRLIGKAVDIREDEVHAVGWSFAYFFLVLASYFVIRPIRDQMGVAGGVENLAWLFTGTLVGMLLLHPIFSALVARYPRRVFIAWIYRVFIGMLLTFYLLFTVGDQTQNIWIGRAFFIWTSVFNLFVVSVFWSFMTDTYHPSQGRRLFGFIAVGGTVGALLGSSITASLVGIMGPINLLLVSALLLELAGRSARAFERHEAKLVRAAALEPDPGDGNGDAAADTAEEKQEEVIGGGILDGIRRVARSRYLLGLAALILLFAVVSTFLYFHLLAIVEDVMAGDDEGQTRLFAMMEIAVQSLTLVTQIFLTGRILRWLGLGLSLAILPLVSIVGFGILALSPVLLVVALFQVLRRAANFAIQRPAREVLYTVVERTDKYKAKNFNDTFVYRAADQLGAWSYTGMAFFGLGLSALALTMVPVSAVWLLLALWLGVRYRRYGQEA